MSEKFKKVLMWGVPVLGVFAAGYYIWYGEFSIGSKKGNFKEKISVTEKKMTETTSNLAFNEDSHTESQKNSHENSKLKTSTKVSGEVSGMSLGKGNRKTASDSPSDHSASEKNTALNSLSYLHKKIEKNSKRCEAHSAIELPGRGPSSSDALGKEPLTKWSDVMAEFHAIKADLLHWLNSGSKKLPKEVVAEMAKQIEELKLRRAPNIDEPDLSWRGLALWGLDKHGAPVINLGGGFIDLLHSSPQRARFELARQIAMAWSPCELRRIGSGHPWGGLAECFGLEDSESKCDKQMSNDTAWGIATAVAYQIRYPSCEPGIMEAKSACMKRIPASIWQDEKK